MTKRRRSTRHGRARGGTLALALACAAVAGGLTGCGTGDGGAGHGPFQRVLDEQAAALRAGDRSGYLAAVDPRAAAYRSGQERVYRNLRSLPLATWAYQVTDVARHEESATVTARLRYRIAGYDRVTTTDTERLRFVRRDGGWRIAAEAADSDTQLWEQGTMTVVRGAHSLVLGVGRDRSGLRRLARAADRAVPAVARVWPGGWSRRTVLEAPSSVADMARLLGSPASSYEGIAAVTTGEAGGGAAAGGSAPADRIVINPQAYGMLSDEGQQVVLTHETTHVATRHQTTRATPMWLSEGIADWAGYRASKTAPREAAPELARAVAGRRPGGDDGDGDGDGPLHRLPTDEDFAFGNDPARLARAYEGGWLACRMVAQQWGQDTLVELYERAGRAGGGRSPDVDAALRSVLGIGQAEFTARWRSYVTELLG
ncbi:basic secretory family protein [Streptomyces albus]|uniref:basic secretory family protein n=1 Tax=Streptomyces TaxID=1883 RepID=UPI001CEDD995|nr:MULTISPECIES: basic secretory family protein [Streptomyces]MDI6407643.1 basic secretory family protein [Streptomyces albus]